MDLNLFEKTELFVENIQLEHVNLTSAASAVAQVLGLETHEVAVIDVRPGLMAIDILKNTVSLSRVAGKEKALLAAIAAIPGVTVTGETRLHSEGILGLVNVSEITPAELNDSVEHLAGQIREALRKRAIVFPTGAEIIDGSIEDTNTPFLVEMLKNMGYRAAAGDVLPDSLEAISGGFRKAVNSGYGLVITTGGVGAEDKDFLVEAVGSVDPDAAMPYIVHYTAGHGRHQKDGVRIAVGEHGNTLFIALPGPHDEVRITAAVLQRGLSEEWDKHKLAANLAQVLRAKLIENMSENRNSVTVHLPPALQSVTGSASITAVGNTAGACLENLIDHFPSLGEMIFNEKHELQGNLDLHIKGRGSVGLDQQLHGGEELYLIDIIAGG